MRVDFIDRSADHKLDDFVQTRSSHRAGADAAAITQHRKPTGYTLAFLEKVADVYYAHTALTHPLDHGKKILRVQSGQAAGWLIHDQDTRLAHQRTGDLDQLLLRDRQRAYWGIERQIRLPDFLQRALGQATTLAPAQPSHRLRLSAKQHVLLHRQIRREVQFLINHRDPAVTCMQRVAWFERLAIEQEAASVRLVRPAEHLHQRAFAGAIFTDQRVHLTGSHLEAHATKCHRRAEALGHAANAQAQWAGFSFLRQDTPRAAG